MFPRTSSTAPAIEFDRLSRWFGRTRAVHEVCFCVPPGEVFGYIGPNGAGKTTSMRILATLEMPHQGDARVEGLSSIVDPDRVRRRLGFMPDSYGTYPNMNCIDYLDFFARAYGLVGKERHGALRKVMGFTQLDALAHKPIQGLSKGMKQRLCLGRALIHDPGVLILDEPAAGLDPRARIELREMIGQLAKDQGKTILISSHILTELAEMCDRVGILERSELLAVGTVDEIRQQLRAGRQVRVRVLDRVSAAAEWITTQVAPNEQKLDGELITFVHTGDPAEEARILRGLVEAGFEVAEFGGSEKSLEEVFMQVTRGIVQ